MKILFALAVISFAALAWAAFAIARHIRKSTAVAANASETSLVVEPSPTGDLSRSGTPQDFHYFNKEASEAPPR